MKQKCKRNGLVTLIWPPGPMGCLFLGVAGLALFGLLADAYAPGLLEMVARFFT